MEKDSFKKWNHVFENKKHRTCFYLIFTKTILGKTNLDFPNKIHAN